MKTENKNRKERGTWNVQSLVQHLRMQGGSDSTRATDFVALTLATNPDPLDGDVPFGEDPYSAGSRL